MSYAFVASVKASAGGAAGVTSGAIDTTGASLLVLAISNHSGFAENAISDSKGNTWNGLTAQISVAVRNRLYYAINPTVGSGHTFTAGNVTDSACAIVAVAFSGAHTTSPFDSENGATTASTQTIQPGSVTPSQDNELVVTAHGQYANTASGDTTINGGFTIAEQILFLSGNNFGVGLAYLIQTSAAAANPTWDILEVGNFAATIACFKEAAAGGSAVPVFMNQYRQRRA